MISSDYQEAKNIDTTGAKIMPNTRTAAATMHVVPGAAVDVLIPSQNACIAKPQRVTVAASSPSEVTSVRFAVDGRRFAVDRTGEQEIWSATLTRRLAPGRRHTLTVVAVDAKGRTASSSRTVRACRG
jgi:hypothetical protein